MNAERLLAHFDRIADTPDAIPRLRRFVLDLAVRGNLVDQDSGDEPASELLKRIASEKSRLIKAGKLRRRNLIKSEVPDGLGFNLPSGWSIAQFSDVLTELQTGPFGSSLRKSDYEVGGTPVINPASIQDGKIVPIEKMAVGENTFERLSRFKLQAGDIVMGRRGEMGRCAEVSEHQDGWLCGTGCLILRLPEDLSPKYLAMLISSPYVREYLARFAVGATMQNLNQSILLRMSIAVPPTAEQYRIVDKVDELIILCDRLEETRAAREDTRDRLTEVSYAHLSVSDTNEVTFRSHAHFVVDALPTLAARADHIKHLRQTMLNLAVRGKLLAQNPADESATEMLKRTKKLPYPARYSRRSPELIPGDCGMSVNKPDLPTPPGWLWVSLVQIARIESGHTPSRARPDWWGGDVPWMGLVDARAHNNGYIYDTIQYTNEAGLANSAARLLPEGTVCFSRTASVGYVVILGRSMATSQDFVNWVPTEVLSSEWLQLVMIAERPAFSRFSKGAVHQTIYYPAWLSMHIVLPPLSEQHRIVAKVDELMTLCNRLEASLDTVDSVRYHLLESLLREALELPVDEIEPKYLFNKIS